MFGLPPINMKLIRLTVGNEGNTQILVQPANIIEIFPYKETVNPRYNSKITFVGGEETHVHETLDQIEGFVNS